MNIYTENQNDIIHETSVDFVLRPCTKEIHIVQYDKSLPVIKVELFRNGERYVLPENAIVNIRVGKLDHTFVYESVLGTNEERNVVYFEISEQTALIAGKIWPVLEVIETNKVACSSPLCFIIERNPIQEGQIESHDDFPIIYELQGMVADHETRLTNIESGSVFVRVVTDPYILYGTNNSGETTTYSVRNFVDLTSNQTITAPKTFNGNVTLNADLKFSDKMTINKDGNFYFVNGNAWSINTDDNSKKIRYTKSDGQLELRGGNLKLSVDKYLTDGTNNVKISEIVKTTGVQEIDGIKIIKSSAQGEGAQLIIQSKNEDAGTTYDFIIKGGTNGANLSLYGGSTLIMSQRASDYINIYEDIYIANGKKVDLGAMGTSPKSATTKEYVDTGLDTKVTKSTTTTGEFAYTRNGSTEGTTRIVFNPQSNPSITGSIVRRNAENKIYTRDLSEGNEPDNSEVISKAYGSRTYLTQAGADTRYVKHISSGSNRIVYGRTTGGDDTSFQAITGNTPNTVAYRGSDGEIKVGMPGVSTSTEEEKLATNRKYVDTGLATKVDKSGGTMTGALEFQDTNHVYSIQASGSDSLLFKRDSSNILALFKNLIIVNTDLRLNTMGTDSKSATTKEFVESSIASAVSRVYRPQGTETVSGLNNLTKAVSMNGDVYNASDDGILNNSTPSESHPATITVKAGDNVVLIWNNGDWYWDKLASDIDLSNYATITFVTEGLATKVDVSTLSNYYTKTETNGLLSNYVPWSSVSSSDSVNTIVQRDSNGEIHSATISGTNIWGSTVHFDGLTTYSNNGINVDSFGNIKLKQNNTTDVFSISTGDNTNLIKVKNNKDLELGINNHLNVNANGIVSVGSYWDLNSTAPFHIGNGSDENNRHDLLSISDGGIWFGFPNNEVWAPASLIKEKLTATYASTSYVDNKRNYVFASLETADVGGISFDQWGNLAIKQSGATWNVSTKVGNAISVDNNTGAVTIPNLQGYATTNNVDTKLTKVTSTSSHNRLYVINTDGSQSTIELSSSSTEGYSVPYRRQDGNIIVPLTPGQNSDATSKEYVDTTIVTKQDVISDLVTIRNGAALGATAVQPSAISDMATQTWVSSQGYLTSGDFARVATTGSYNDLSDKPTIPVQQHLYKHTFDIQIQNTSSYWTVHFYIDIITNKNASELSVPTDYNSLKDLLDEYFDEGPGLSVPFYNGSGTNYDQENGFIININNEQDIVISVCHAAQDDTMLFDTINFNTDEQGSTYTITRSVKQLL